MTRMRIHNRSYLPPKHDFERIAPPSGKWTDNSTPQPMRAPMIASLGEREKQLTRNSDETGTLNEVQERQDQQSHSELGSHVRGDVLGYYPSRRRDHP